MSGRFIYHYHVRREDQATVRTVDGIALLDAPVQSQEDYHQLKTLIRDKDGFLADLAPEQIPIVSLSLLGREGEHDDA